MGNEVDTGNGPAPEPGEVTDSLLAAVEEAVREVVAAEVMPRRNRLTAADIGHKSSPLDLVTTADRRAEEALTRRLTDLLPGSVVVGEEAVGVDPSVLDRLRGPAPVWVVDPIDGTAAFVRGDEGFSTLVTLVSRGRPLASWTYGPCLDLFATARPGRGAHLDGQPLRTRPDSAGPLRIWTSDPVFRTGAERVRLARLAAAATSLPCQTSAGLAYLEVARGRADAVAFFWEAPWDHAAGTLLVTEAGGSSLTLAGRPFAIPGGNALPFTTARDEPTARWIIDTMAGVDAAGTTRDAKAAER